MTLKGNCGHGYVRLDWYTPEGLSTWGDGRLTILGTDGFIELRKCVDITRNRKGEHLFLVDHHCEQYIDCTDQPLPYGPCFVSDVLNRTETHAPQWRTFLAMELALIAEQKALRMGNLG